VSHETAEAGSGGQRGGARHGLGGAAAARTRHRRTASRLGKVAPTPAPSTRRKRGEASPVGEAAREVAQTLGPWGSGRCGAGRDEALDWRRRTSASDTGWGEKMVDSGALRASCAPPGGEDAWRMGHGARKGGDQQLDPTQRKFQL
jgi:hypothetical protein